MELRGVGAAPGVAVGPVWRLDRGGALSEPLPDIRAAADRAAADLTELAARVRSAGRAEDAAIFEAQAVMALDPMLLETAEAKVAAAAAGGRPKAHGSADLLAAAVESSAREAADVLATLPDELLAARAADVRDVGGRIARVIAGRSIALPDRPSIALAEDLPPSVTAEIPDGLLLGIALERGSAVSHAAILARGLGIPAVVAVPELLAVAGDAAASGDADGALEVGLDGTAGRVLLAPTAAQHAELEAAAAELRRAIAAAAALRNAPGQTADGHLVPLLANIGRPEDAERALTAGAEGVGLFRTEFLFVGRSDAPSEDEQAAAYAEVLRAFGERPVVIRLLDIGGDKPVPYLHLEREDNPFLGVRGLRLGYRDRELLVTQLRAIARAGATAGTTPWVMAPMVATVEDVELVHALVAQAVEDLDAHGVARASSLKIGIMVEVPSAALMAPELGKRVAFFSVGSNDLTQYVLAMDRTHPALATVADALHPAVLRAIRLTVDGARQAGIEVAVCGELGGDPLGAQVLVGLGVAELSMDAARIGAVRLALRGRTLAELRELATRALACGTASEVRALLETG